VYQINIHGDKLFQDKTLADGKISGSYFSDKATIFFSAMSQGTLGSFL
jgi:hypothetical protein